MNKFELEKRYRGLHYEVGRLPNWLMKSKFYWGLPHELRWGLYQISPPKNIRRLHKLRSQIPTNIDCPTLKPFLETRSIFVHIPKSAGISVSFSLYGRKVGDHRTVSDYKLCFRENEFNSFFKFAFVRNPWDRLLSAYLYLKQGGRNKKDYDWSIKYLSSYKSFDEFVKGWINKDNICLGLHFRPQCEFLCTDNYKLEVDFVGRFENIANDYEYIRTQIGFGKNLEVKNQNNGGKRDYRPYYNEYTKSIVASVYQEDIKIFGYEFDTF